MAGALEPAAFFSYARADDEHDKGYLTSFRRALASEISAQLGDDFLIFQDRDDILWGQRWRSRIDESVDSATILIAVLTPRFFRSDACRREVERFFDREARLDRKDLIMPLYYIAVPGWARESSDHLIAELAERNLTDWRDLRFESFDNPAVRRKIAQLAREVVAALERESVVSTAGVVEEVESDFAVGESAFVELVAEAEEAMPLFGQAIVDLTSELQRAGEIATDKAAEIEQTNSAAKPMAARLSVIRQLTEELGGPAEKMELAAADYLEQLDRVDGGIHALVERVPSLTDPDEIATAREFADVLRSLSSSADEGLAALDGFRSSLRSVSQTSSTVRPVMGRMYRAIASILPSRERFREWTLAMDGAVDAIPSENQRLEEPGT